MPAGTSSQDLTHRSNYACESVPARQYLQGQLKDDAKGCTQPVDYAIYILDGGYRSSNQCTKNAAMAKKDETQRIPKQLSYKEELELRKRIAKLPEITIEPLPE
jgi:hypothetical protein